MRWCPLPNISLSITSMRLAKKIVLIRCPSRKISFSMQIAMMIAVFDTRSVYPTMEQLAETVNDVFNHLKSVVFPSFSWWIRSFSSSIKSAIGFGVGVGANILTRFAVRIRTKVETLIRSCWFLVATSIKNVWSGFGQLYLAWSRMVRRFLA